jgi:YgiT-type zinc finger domain-containing protein
MNCPTCGNANMIKKTINKCYDKDGEPLIVANIPVLECPSCGERGFDGEIIDKVHKLVKESSPPKVKISYLDFSSNEKVVGNV